MGVRHRYTGVDFPIEYATITQYNVVFKDVFVMKYFYFLLHEWLVEEGYATREDDKFPEVFYLQKENPAVGKELWVRWRLSKDPGAPKGFWKFVLDIDMHCLGLTDVEAMVKNQKVKANKGEVEVSVVANLVWDADNSWKKSAWLRPLKKQYLRWFMRKKREMHSEQLYTEAYRLQGAIKTYLKLENFLPEKEWEGFWAKRTGE